MLMGRRGLDASWEAPANFGTLFGTHFGEHFGAHFGVPFGAHFGTPFGTKMISAKGLFGGAWWGCMSNGQNKSDPDYDLNRVRVLRSGGFSESASSSEFCAGINIYTTTCVLQKPWFFGASMQPKPCDETRDLKKAFVNRLRHPNKLTFQLLLSPSSHPN